MSRCSGGTLYCLKCPKFSTKSRDDSSFHFSKKHSAAGPKNNHMCKNAALSFQGFISWDTINNVITQQKLPQVERRRISKVWRTQEITKPWKKSNSRVDLSGLILKYKNLRHCVFNFVVNNLTAQVIEGKLNRVLYKLKCATKPNLALGSILKKIEDGKFRNFYAHENNTLLEQSKLVSNKNDMTKLKEILKKTDVMESCTKERSNTKWRF